MIYYVIKHEWSGNYAKVVQAEDETRLDWTEPSEDHVDATPFETVADVLRFILLWVHEQTMQGNNAFAGGCVARWQVIEVNETASFVVIA